jgi:hypothetical protein
MEHRPEPRLETDIPVRVWGMDADGRPFFQSASAGNISSHGAMLSRISHSLKPGEVIGVQYGDKKARFRIVWMVDGGAVRKIEAGIEILDNQQNPWEELTPSDPEMQQPRGKNKRRFVRHKMLFPIEISFEDSRRPHMQTSATDIGGRGCYVETLMPLASGTKTVITFWIDSEKVKTTGIVRASDPGVGMGIEFTALDNTVQQQLQQYLDKLDTGFASRASAKTAASTE